MKWVEEFIFLILDCPNLPPPQNWAGASDDILIVNLGRV
jgi:hypothetical protein